MINMDVIITNWVCNSISFFASENNWFICLEIEGTRERKRACEEKRQREREKKVNPQLKNSNMGRVT